MTNYVWDPSPFGLRLTAKLKVVENKEELLVKKV